MASKKKPSAPLTFDLSTGLLRKIEDYRKKAGVRSKSEVIRDAIEMYDYAGFSREVEPHRQISVRLPVGQKRELARLAKQKKVSLGELLRVALEALPENPAKKGTNGAAEPAKRGTTPRKTASRKAAPKKGPVKKSSGKTAAASKTTAKRAPAKKAATKSAPTRAAARQATTQRATTGRTPARKAVARKASSPRATSRKPAKRTASRKK